MNVWQAVASALHAEKTDFVFGLPGGDLFFDSLLDYPEIKPIQVREETAGPFMAMGFALSSFANTFSEASVFKEGFGG